MMAEWLIVCLSVCLLGGLFGWCLFVWLFLCLFVWLFACSVGLFGGLFGLFVFFVCLIICLV